MVARARPTAAKAQRTAAAARATAAAVWVAERGEASVAAATPTRGMAAVRATDRAAALSNEAARERSSRARRKDPRAAERLRELVGVRRRRAAIVRARAHLRVRLEGACVARAAAVEARCSPAAPRPPPAARRPPCSRRSRRCRTPACSPWRWGSSAFVCPSRRRSGTTRVSRRGASRSRLAVERGVDRRGRLSTRGLRAVRVAVRRRRNLGCQRDDLVRDRPAPARMHADHADRARLRRRPGG